MKYIILLFVCFVSFGIQAQQSEKTIQKSVDQMTETYSLTAAQSSSVKDLMTKKSEELTTLQGMNLSHDKYANALKDLMERYDAKMMNILDDKQKEMYKRQSAIKPSILNPTQKDN